MSSDYLRKLELHCRDSGWEIERQKNGHLRLSKPGLPGFVTASSTPSCWFAFENVKADMRRLERGLAVLSIGFKKRGSPIIFPDHPKTTAKQRRQRKAAVRMAMDGMDYES